MFGIRRGNSSRPALMKAKHPCFERHAQKSAKRGAVLGWVRNQRFVSIFRTKPGVLFPTISLPLAFPYRSKMALTKDA